MKLLLIKTKRDCLIMAKEEFDLMEELKECPKPEFFKRAFLRCVDTSKIKSKADLGKAFKKFGETR